MIASCGFLENELRQFSKEEGVTLETLGVDLRTRVKRSGGSKRKSEEEEVQCEVLTLKKLLRAGMMPARA